ncbi:MAG: LPS translocon maturation chaperone LptM [Burkholderiaceae bacterium]
MNRLRSLSYRLIPLMAVILVGCGQKGPLTPPKAQFPAPSAVGTPDPSPTSPPANTSSQPQKK